MRDQRAGRDDLRELLRQGDPAEDGRGPDEAEIAHLRARVLSETAAGPATGSLGPVWGLAGVAAVALLALAVVGWLLNPVEPLPDNISSLPEMAPGSDAGNPDPTEIVRAPDPAPVVSTAEEESPMPRPTEPPQVAATAGVTATVTDDAAARPARQVQLRGPGGTKILWKLDPEFHL